MFLSAGNQTKHEQTRHKLEQGYPKVRSVLNATKPREVAGDVFKDLESLVVK